MAWNTLYDYEEVPTNPNSGAVPSPEFYRDKTHTALAYEVGIGLQYELPHKHTHMFHYLVSADYRYMNMGEAELGTMHSQTTSDHLEVSPLSAQALVLAVTIIF